MKWAPKLKRLLDMICIFLSIIPKKQITCTIQNDISIFEWKRLIFLNFEAFFSMNYWHLFSSSSLKKNISNWHNEESAAASFTSCPSSFRWPPNHLPVQQLRRKLNQMHSSWRRTFQNAWNYCWLVPPSRRIQHNDLQFYLLSQMQNRLPSNWVLCHASSQQNFQTILLFIRGKRKRSVSQTQCIQQ